MQNDDDLDDSALLDAADETSLPATTEAELRSLKQRIVDLELQVRRHQQAAAVLEHQLEKANDTLSFRLGYLLIHGPKSWTALRRLPGDLLELYREAKRRRRGRGRQGQRAPQPEPSLRVWRLPEHFAEEAFRVYLAEGLDPALAFVAAKANDDRERAVALVRLAKALRATDARSAANLAERAYRLEPNPGRAKWLAFAQYSAGDLVAPAALLAALPKNLSLKPAEQARIAEIDGLARLRSALPTIPPKAHRAYEPEPNSSLYVTASSLPFTVSGYTVRSHAVIRAIESADVRVTAALRPGYPADRGILVPESAYEHDQVTYHQSPLPNSRGLSPQAFSEAAAQALVALARRARPQLIHAASNHVNALPALLAARRLGVPFVYEVRGMWELSAATRQQHWEQTERFGLERDLETLVAREADQVLTLTEGLASALVERGVLRQRIAIIPNSVDPARFTPRAKDAELLRSLGSRPAAFTLVYAGSLLAYEGLDDELCALSELCREGIDATLLIAGDGEAREPLQQLARDLEIEGRVHFLGRLEPANVPRLWSLADAAAFPRKPFKVCQLVSPLKPLEPMTMGIPVVVSDVAALKEMVQHDRTGLVHRAGDAKDLAAQLRRLALEPTLRRKLGDAASAAVLRERTWQVAGNRVVELYRALTQPAGASQARFSAENRAP